PEAVLQFQVLEKIFNVLHYKAITQAMLIQKVSDELTLVYHKIDDVYDRIIATIRLAFYGTSEFRRTYFRMAIELLKKTNENDKKLKLMMKLKPLIGIYDDLRTDFDGMVNRLQNKTYFHLINSHYGRILSIDQSSSYVQSLFRLFAQLNDAKLLIENDECLTQLWINLSIDVNNETNIEKLLKIALDKELFLTPLAAIVIDELLEQGKEEAISILFPYLIKPSNEVLPIVHRWFRSSTNQAVRNFAAILLVEARHVFESAIDTIVKLLENDNDQIRYRAQRIFQHPERDPKEPNKRISVIGARTLMQILTHLSKKTYMPRVSVYLRTFFYDLLWDDPVVYINLLKSITRTQEINSNNLRPIFYLNKMKFINGYTWNAVMNSLQSTFYPCYFEEIFQSTMTLANSNQITENNWNDFVPIISAQDTTQFREQFYITHTDVEISSLILDEICALTHVHDEEYFEILEA
ncbi:unnamed protein product, partial [Adineta ricciae]